MNDAQLIEHLHARGWSLDKIDVAMIREGAAALQADALAAIKAARVQALEPLSDDRVDEIIVDRLGLDADEYAMADFARAIEAAHGIREESGRGKS